MTVSHMRSKNTQYNPFCGRIVAFPTSYKKSGSRNRMVTSNFRPGVLFTKVRTPVSVRKFRIRNLILTCVSVTLFTKLSYVRKIVHSCVNICTV